jgi:hypothetical protein
LKKAVIAETILIDAGVDHRDICPRDILIQGSNYDDDDTLLCDIDVDAKIIDFDIAEAISHPHSADRMYKNKSSERRKDIWPAKISSLIGTYYGHMAEFVVEGWNSNEGRVSEEWLW